MRPEPNEFDLAVPEVLPAAWQSYLPESSRHIWSNSVMSSPNFSDYLFSLSLSLSSRISHLSLSLILSFSLSSSHLSLSLSLSFFCPSLSLYLCLWILFRGSWDSCQGLCQRLTWGEMPLFADTLLPGTKKGAIANTAV